MLSRTVIGCALLAAALPTLPAAAGDLPKLSAGVGAGFRLPYNIFEVYADGQLYLPHLLLARGQLGFGPGVSFGGGLLLQAYAGFPLAEFDAETTYPVIDSQSSNATTRTTLYHTESIPVHRVLSAEVGFLETGVPYQAWTFDKNGQLLGSSKVVGRLPVVGAGVRYLSGWNLGSASDGRNMNSYWAHVLVGVGPRTDGEVHVSDLLGSDFSKTSGPPLGLEVGFEVNLWAQSFAMLSVTLGVMPGGYKMVQFGIVVPKWLM